LNQFLLVEASPAHNLDVRELVMKILNEEYALDLQLAELPDLVDVHHSYRGQASGNFWVAIEDGSVRGCIGVMQLGRGDFELRRMYVEAGARGRGLAQQLLNVALGWSAARGVQSIYLETHHRWQAAHHIYEKNGFRPVRREDLPAEFPVVRIADGFYRLQLARGSSTDPGKSA